MENLVNYAPYFELDKYDGNIEKNEKLKKWDKNETRTEKIWRDSDPSARSASWNRGENCRSTSQNPVGKSPVYQELEKGWEFVKFSSVC